MLVNAISNEAKTEDLSPSYNLTFGPTTSVTFNLKERKRWRGTWLSY